MSPDPTPLELAEQRRSVELAQVEYQRAETDLDRHRSLFTTGILAIARALACDPDLVLADDPTGNLDTASGKDILHLFEELAGKGRTLLVITHDSGIASRTHRSVHIQDGRITEDQRTA